MTAGGTATKPAAPASGPNQRRRGAPLGGRLRDAPPSRPSDPQWYKDAIIYEVHVRAFFDSNGDGKGDFAGLTAKLDYLADLGVTAIWLLPFYPSPGRDDGYDIADFEGVNPDYGTLRDVRRLIKEAHRRGLRVITELVCNHTSDQHPWFQRARRARPGTSWREFYVWSDTPDKYLDARIIFTDTETSNWTWDPVAEAYYWHRFFSHQPDLNFDNPRVRDAIFKTMDHWLDMGVDGLRLDAIPYLYEREGTNCENLPDTHEFLRQLRRRIDDKYGDRMLLAEANQWPEDSVAYFGEGDECHMAFHFPVMPRMFMALRMEDRFPIVDILTQTPQIPETSQWALFLRNHDELTLEMVTDEERDYMYRVYATDPQMRINVGIRRRLAPLLGNHRRRIELLNGLLFSLPGTPVVYYGDEIGMGDNVYVGDRNGVRTPMQWSGNRNAGFSSAARQQLYLPVIVDPEYHYEAVNVEAQQANRNSLLWWMKRLIALRKRHPAFGRGTVEFLHPDNRRILAFIRQYEGETILVVANLSRFVQYAEIDLSAFEGRTPVELFGQSEFPPIGRHPYFLTLGPHGFLWFSLQAAADPATAAASAPSDLPTLPYALGVAELASPHRRGALAEVLAAWSANRRWFRGKARKIRSAEITDAIPMSSGGMDGLLVVLSFQFSDGDPEEYFVPIAACAISACADILDAAPWAGIARLGPETLGLPTPDSGDPDEVPPVLEPPDEPRILVDATRLDAFARAILDAMSRRRTVRGPHSTITGDAVRSLRRLGPELSHLPSTPSRAEQSNSSIIIGDRLMLKLYRRLEAGINPDLEIGRFLTAHGFPNVPAVAGSVEYRRGEGGAATIATAQAFVPNEGDAWEYTLDEVGDYLERVITLPEPPTPGPATTASLVERATGPNAEEAVATIGAYLEWVELLGRRTGELHVVLASDPGDRAFRPEPFSAHYQRSLYQSVRSTVHQNLRLLARSLDTLGPDVRAAAETAIAKEPDVQARLAGLLSRRLDGQRIRVHGDFHLGQVLHTGRDFMLIDFEGEPGRPLGERRLKRSALTDVTGMIRSFHYAASGSLVRTTNQGSVRPEDVAVLAAWVRHWYVWTSASYLRGYRETTAGQAFLPTADEDWAILLDALLLQKAFYEVDYELNNRPDWLTTPLEGIAAILSG